MCRLITRPPRRSPDMAFNRAQPSRKKRGVPVRLPDGSTKDSLCEAARDLGCQPGALYHVSVGP